MRRVIVTALLALCGCAMAGRPPPSARPLGDEGELHVYLAPLPHPGRRLTFAIQELAAVGEGGETVPLEVTLPAVSASAPERDERLLATGRLAQGRYLGLRLTVAKASLAGDEAPVRLLEPEPTMIEVPFDVRRGQALVLALTLDPDRSIKEGFAFAPSLRGAVPARPAPGVAGACSSANS